MGASLQALEHKNSELRGARDDQASGKSEKGTSSGSFVARFRWCPRRDSSVLAGRPLAGGDIAQLGGGEGTGQR